MVGRQGTRSVSRREARRFLAKAEEFVGAAEAAFAASRYSASGLAAIHAGISAADAVTARRLLVVSSAPDHLQAVRLLRGCLENGLPMNTERQLVGLLKMKNEVEYSGQAVTVEKARVMVDQATRFVAWARSIVGES